MVEVKVGGYEKELGSTYATTQTRKRITNGRVLSTQIGWAAVLSTMAPACTQQPCHCCVPTSSDLFSPRH
ncbi:hypothetical protein J6590_088318 [Homalodisca vitripennis]|nr:hypothetical protein J6590_088318 [Homalodisca vitripennis]